MTRLVYVRGWHVLIASTPRGAHDTRHIEVTNRPSRSIPVRHKQKSWFEKGRSLMRRLVGKSA